MKNPQPASATSGQFRRRLARALVTVGLIVGTIASTAKPAEAASLVIGCFTPTQATVRASGIPVWLQMWDGFKYVTVGYGVLSDFGMGGVAGCAYWSIPPALQYQTFKVKINDSIMSYGKYYWGETRPAALGPGTSTVQGPVTCVGALCAYW